MTFFTLVFLYFGITEVYDETELSLFKPRQLEREEKMRIRLSQQQPEQEQEG